MLPSSASGTEVIPSLRGCPRGSTPGRFGWWKSPAAPVSSCPKRRAACPAGLSTTLWGSQCPAPTGWVSCALPGANTTVPGDAGPPSTAEKTARAPAHGEQPALPVTVQSTACRYPASPAPASCERKAAAGCIAKLCVGSFLATHGISSYCFSSPRLSLQSVCQGQLHLLSSSPHRL